MALSLLFMNLGGFEIIVLLIFFLIPALLWLWAIIDLLKSNFSNSANKIIWAMVIIFMPLLGALLYLAIGRGQKVKALKD